MNDPEHFRFIDDRAIRDFDDEVAPSTYWFLVPADGNDAEALVQLLQAADEWTTAGDQAPVYDRVHADQVHALLDSIRRSFDAYVA
jgi:hypothetical protein